MSLGRALPMLKSTLPTSRKLKAAGGKRGWYLHKCLCKTFMLPLSTRCLFPNKVVNIDVSQASLVQTFLVQAHSYWSLPAPQRQAPALRLKVTWEHFCGALYAPCLHSGPTVPICSLPSTLVSLQKKPVYVTGRKLIYSFTGSSFTMLRTTQLWSKPWCSV